MILCFEVIIQIVVNLGSIFYEEAPLYAHSLSEAPEAEEILKERSYPMMKGFLQEILILIGNKTR